jgi:hypothetical protein
LERQREIPKPERGDERGMELAYTHTPTDLMLNQLAHDARARCGMHRCDGI